MQQSTQAGDITKSKYAEEFEEIESIGKGGFGSVYKCKKKLDEKLYAIKKVILRSPNAEDWERAQSEVKVLANLDHKRIVRYHTSWWEPRLITETDSEITGSQNTDDFTSEGDESPESGYKGGTDSKRSMSTTDESNSATGKKHYSDISDDVEARLGRTGILYIQMELCGTTLKDWMNVRNSKFNVEDEDFLTCLRNGEGLMIFREILQGVQCIHDQGLIHRDLKPLNVFMVENGHAKVGDLGLVTRDIFSDTPASPENQELIVGVKKGIKHTAKVGTPTYSAPEQLKGTKYTNKADIYSLGVILLELYQKINTEMEICKTIENLKRDIISESMYKWPVQTEYIRKMTSIDPETRPNVQDILADRELFLSKNHIIEDLQEERDVYTDMIKRSDASMKKVKRKLGQKKKAVEQMREEIGKHAIENLQMKRKIKQKDDFLEDAIDAMVEREAVKIMETKEANYIAEIQKLKKILNKKNKALKEKDKLIKQLKEEVLTLATVRL